jgi:hypothetical protein
MSTVGNRFAYRERVRAYGEPVRPVEVTREGPPRSNKARVRWLDGEYEGLEEWVPKIRLLAPWKEAEDFLEDERRMLAAVEVSEDACDEVTWKAADEVFGTMSRISDPSEEVILGYKAIEEDLLVIQNLDAATRRLGLDKEEMLGEPYAFVAPDAPHTPDPVAGYFATPQELVGLGPSQPEPPNQLVGGEPLSVTNARFHLPPLRTRRLHLLSADARVSVTDNQIYSLHKPSVFWRCNEESVEQARLSQES